MSRVNLAAETGQSDYKIEPMTPHDLLEVVEIEEACRLSLWGWDSYYAELARPEAIMIVARRERADKLTGHALYGFLSARVSAQELHINNIGVHESARRRGIGNALMQAVFASAGKLGAHTAILEVRAGNVAAQALYRRYGFEIVGRRRQYYREPPEDALMMRAALKSPT
ncbi:MAG TPA: ribosomal protein S18-alanine N-acetyltransferase [Pyrinomonadaceae bacterium]|jgi:ribosomal-protein-alanine N-acetyltransferase|nr:ribosomal protein S18-alanine N-acetyltransferase [Pyrinomonadaceae bacterium]